MYEDDPQDEIVLLRLSPLNSMFLPVLGSGHALNTLAPSCNFSPILSDGLSTKMYYKYVKWYVDTFTVI